MKHRLCMNYPEFEHIRQEPTIACLLVLLRNDVSSDVQQFFFLPSLTTGSGQRPRSRCPVRQSARVLVPTTYLLLSTKQEGSKRKTIEVKIRLLSIKQIYYLLDNLSGPTSRPLSGAQCTLYTVQSGWCNLQPWFLFSFIYALPDSSKQCMGGL